MTLAPITLVRSIYAALNAHRVNGVGDYLHDDCVRHYVRGDSPIAGDHLGRAAVMASYAYLINHTGGAYRIEVGNVLANDVIAASFHRELGTRARDGATLDAELLVRWRIENGRVLEIWDFANDIPTLNEFLR